MLKAAAVASSKSGKKILVFKSFYFCLYKNKTHCLFHEHIIEHMDNFARQLIPSAVLFGIVTISNSANNAKSMSGKLYM